MIGIPDSRCIVEILLIWSKILGDSFGRRYGTIAYLKDTFANAH